MNEHEKAWIEYAGKVLGKDGTTACEQCCLANHCDQRVRRWPGFLGPRYDPNSGGVFLIGAVHNEEDLWKDDTTYIVGKVEKAARAWIADKITDRKYLDAVREHYPPLIESWQGPVWGRFRHILASIEVELDQVLFMNLAKCFTNAPTEPFVKACMGKYPDVLHQLAEQLNPRIIFIQQSSDFTRPLLETLETEQRASAVR